MDVTVHSPDLVALRRDLDDVQGGFDTAAHVADRAAAELVIEKASAAAHALGGVAAKSAPALKATDGRAEYGGLPYALGAEFGSVEFHQFKPWLGAGEGAGYFFTPAVRDTAGDVDEAYYDEADKLLKRHDL